MATGNKEGKINKQQSNQQIARQASDFNAEFAEDYIKGNTKSQSQKKSGRQLNKEKTN